MATSKVSAEERMLRKRHAARVRQQRCRARKRQALIEKVVLEKVNAPSVTTSQSENQHPNQRVTPRFRRPPSPRSVYWKEQAAPHWQAPRYHSERPRSWSYDSPHMETRYDVGPVKPSYSRYSTSVPPRVLMPQFAAVQQPQPRYYAPQQYPVERKSEYYMRRAEQEYRSEQEYRQQHQQQHQQAPPQPRAPVAWPVTSAPMRLPVAHPRPAPKQDPIKSKEEAAVDAILSLKTGGEIVAPPKIKRCVDDSSAFKALQEQHLHREVRPGFYMTMRAN